ncbi:hypothetical protein FPCIR_11986 [Fusarium pseudocircinatum]|uniref:Uncharacterized protein n=1 Tax=Fusarium pseudocircinatum TaxID=56676 RepID=A0A8H5NVV4_9HYPO|nr:hypothetical protein FPCIR_11986 [Fusarium pseudocircinatum]
MLTSWILKLATLAVTILPRLAAAGTDPAAAYGTFAQPSLDLPDAVSNASSTVESEALLEECDPTITVCGTTANVKVVRTHNVTSYVTNYHVHEEITELPTSTRTVVSVIVSTNTTNVEGQCRDTTVYIEPTPLIVTVDVNTTTTREVVPITNITSITTSWVPHKKISQCIIKRTSIGLAPGPGYGSASPPPSAPSQQPPPATGSAGNYDYGQPAPSIPPARASSVQGSGRQRYVHFDEHFDECPNNSLRRRLANSRSSSSIPFPSSEESSSTSESASSSDFRASGASTSSSASGASNASGASSSTSSSSSRSSAWF